MNPGNLIWIFGTGRSGSTWLMRMMSEMPRTAAWNEPKVGKLFGEFYEHAHVGERKARNFILGEPAREGWVPLIREFVLGSIRYRHPRAGPNFHLVIKEPNGSLGAPLILEALPESRVILLLRDPRDVLASHLDAAREGSWLHARRLGRMGLESPADRDPDGFVERAAKAHAKNVQRALEAFDSHHGPKVPVKYEELSADTITTMKRIYSTLGIPVNQEQVAEAVEKHCWENIPEEEKGSGKIFRRGAPGGWKDDLTPEQARLVGEIAAPALEEFYPARESAATDGSTEDRCQRSGIAPPSR